MTRDELAALIYESLASDHDQYVVSMGGPGHTTIEGTAPSWNEHMVLDETFDALAGRVLALWRLVPVGSDQELVLLHHQGFSDQQIAERLQQSTRTVATRRRKMGLGYNDGKLADQHRAASELNLPLVPCDTCTAECTCPKEADD